MAPGDYVVQVLDPNTSNCVKYVNIRIGETGDVNANVEILAQSECGLATGSVLITADDVPETNIVWNDNYIGAEREDLPAGIYEVILTNTVGCMDTIVFTLENIVDDFNVQIDSVQDITCAGNVDGEVFFTTNPEITNVDDYTVYIEAVSYTHLTLPTIPLV